MAKKKRRYRRTKKRKPPQTSSTRCVDAHHLCWQRRAWGYGALRELRSFHYCIIRIPKYTLHKYIHAKMPGIPVPKAFNAKSALFQLKLLEKYGGISDNDPIEKRLMVLAALFDCSEQPTADAFRKQARIVREFKSPP